MKEEKIKLTLTDNKEVICDFDKFSKMTQEEIFKLCSGKKIKKVDFIK